MEQITPQSPRFPTGKQELIFGAGIVLISFLLFNCVIYGGFFLGYAVASILMILCTAGYLLCSGYKLSGYTGTVLALCLVIAASFARSDDGLVKFMMLCFLTVGVNIALCQLAGKGRYSAKGVGALLDVPAVIFPMGFGCLPQSFRGLYQTAKEGGTGLKKGGAVALGAGISALLLAVLLPLLTSADAAFEGLINQLPSLRMTELLTTLIFGLLLACPLYTRAVALRHQPVTPPEVRERKGVHPLTVNTVLLAVAVLYLAYLFSQLAYLWGGLSGILPEGYDTVSYARRGFFEMALLCFLNLSIISLAAGLVKKQKGLPKLTVVCCLFIGLFTLFLTLTSGAKMVLYIQSFGLTRLRVLTQIITLFLGVTACIVCLWLVHPKLPYMKIVLLTALVMGCITAWVDVDTVVARYNVSAYRSGALPSVDVDYLINLGDGAIPAVLELTEDKDPEVAKEAKRLLERGNCSEVRDWRNWNMATAKAGKLLKEAGFVVADYIFYGEPPTFEGTRWE